MPSEGFSDGIFVFVRDIVMLPFDFQTAFCFQEFDVGMAILIYVRWQGGIVMPPLGFQTASYRTVRSWGEHSCPPLQGRDFLVNRNAHPASETLLRHSHAGRNLDI
ncbi:hypothetical protein [Neisseria meningitidis]|uniref:hypothetical protein n=1 Tax=Neisseria meningitidis TaxID=487 RepID=UPI00214BDF44|nr:hypothetical protein [Neisseria meningitidis]